MNTDKTPFQYNSYGVVANQVEIDVLTGEVQVLQTDILFDCGVRLVAVCVAVIHVEVSTQRLTSGKLRALS